MRFWALPAAVAAVALALGACSTGNPEPPPIDTPTTGQSATPEATATLSAPAKPTARPSPTGDVVQTGGTGLDAATKAEARAFAGQVLAALDAGGATGDFAKALALFDESCESCKRGIAYAQKIYANGNKIVGGKYENPKYSVARGGSGEVIVQVDSTIGAYQVVDAAGKQVDKAPAEKSISNFALSKSGSSWHVVEWTYS